jgi:hypothetical protein
MFKRIVSSLALLALVSGCATASKSAVAPTTAPSMSVAANDFDALWTAIDETSRELLFMPARQDRRVGLYRTDPMVSSQWFEPWRQELKTMDAVIQSSLGTIRRTLTVDVDRQADGTFTATPRVRIERLALAERRMTTSASYRSAFAERRRGTYGSAEADAGLNLPDSYWYEIGNDDALERAVADRIEEKLQRKQAVATR